MRTDEERYDLVVRLAALATQKSTRPAARELILEGCDEINALSKALPAKPKAKAEPKKAPGKNAPKKRAK